MPRTSNTSRNGPDLQGGLGGFGRLPRSWIWVVVLAAVGLLSMPSWALPGTAGDLDDDVIYRAMRDELERNMARLEMEDLQRPYYLEYTVRDSDSASASASFGALVSSSSRRSRRLQTDLRVGGYVFDNTNFSGGRSSGSARLALDDDYDAIRHEIWLATDRAYKTAIEVLARKQAAIKTQNLQDQPDDLSRAEPNVHVSDPISLSVDRGKREEMLRRLSSIFEEFPLLQDSWVSWNGFVTNQYFVNSEGFRHRWGDGLMSLTAYASTQADDGMRLSDAIALRAPIDKGLPPEEEMAEKIKKMAADLSARARARSPEDYTGPVLLEGSAAADFFVELFVENLQNPRVPLFQSAGQARSFTGPRLVRKLGRRVLPKTFTVFDDPTLKEWEGQPLLGWYPVDDDGLPPQRVDLVENGKLMTLLMSRVPTQKVAESNGHGRSSGGSRVVGAPGNLFVESKEAVSEEDLRKVFLEMCGDEDLEYGILVRKNFSGGGGGGSRIAAYRVYVEDGREEPAKGLTFQGVTVGDLRDIVAAGQKRHVTHFSARGSLATLVAPALLIEEMELRKPPPQRDKSPYLPHPAFQD